jgi:hypothetical protein
MRLARCGLLLTFLLFNEQLHIQPPFNPTRLILPYLPLIPGLNSTYVSISYRGIAQIDGQTVHDIQLQRILPIVNANQHFAAYLTTELFIDSSTFQVVMMQDFLAQHGVRQVRYSDYRPVNGVLVPFSISEQIEGQPTWQIQLSQINFNAGILDSDFQL